MMRPERFQNALTYGLPGTERVQVRNLEYGCVDGTPLAMDIYYPPGSKAAACLPSVIFVAGYPDSAAQRILGSPLKDFGQFVSWARLTAVSGMAAITYQTQQPGDLGALVEYLRQNAASFNLDADRIGIWACSGNVPTAMSFAMQESREFIRCAALLYGFMLTPDNMLREQINLMCGSRGCYAAELPDVTALRRDLPLLVVRAGLDSIPYLNESIDQFWGVATEGGIPLTLVDYADGIHGFDVADFWDSTPDVRSGEIVWQTLEFLGAKLVD